MMEDLMDPLKAGLAEFLEEIRLSDLPRPLQEKRFSPFTTMPDEKIIEDFSLHAPTISQTVNKVARLFTIQADGDHPRRRRSRTCQSNATVADGLTPRPADVEARTIGIALVPGRALSRPGPGEQPTDAGDHSVPPTSLHVTRVPACGFARHVWFSASSRAIRVHRRMRGMSPRTVIRSCMCSSTWQPLSFAKPSLNIRRSACSSS